MFDCLKMAFRRLRRRPAASLTVVALLGGGVGVGAGLFNVAAGILWQPLPFPDSDRLVQINTAYLDGGRQTKIEYFTPEQFLDVNGLTGFECLAAVKEAGRGNIVYLSGVDEPRRLRAAFVSRDFFLCLGASPNPGSQFSGRPDSDDRQVILSHAFWRLQFGADPDAVGGNLLLNGEPHVVAGVMPGFLDQNGSEIIQGDRVDLWMPLSPRRIVPGEVAYRLIGRLKPERSLTAANREFDALLASETAPELWRGAAARITSLKEEVVGPTRRYLLALGLAGLTLLVLACANSAGLLLSQAERRGRDSAIQSVLGASRLRLLGELSTEALLLSAAAAAVAFFACRNVTLAFQKFAPAEIPRLQELDLSTGTFALAFALLAGFAFLTGFLALRSPVRGRSLEILKLNGVGAFQAISGGRLRNVAIIAETAAAIVLLFSAGLLYQSFARLSAVDPGFRRADVQAFDIFLPASKYGSARLSQAPLFFEALRERVEGLPGVADVAFTSSTPFAARDYYSSGGWRVRRVDHRYFELLEIPLVQGRGLSADHVGRSVKEAVVSQALASRIFPDINPVGEKLEGYEVVGVAGEVRHESLDAAPEPVLYVSHRQEPDVRMSMLVRTDGRSDGLSALIRQRVRELDPDQPVSAGAALVDLAGSSASMVYRRLFLGLLTAFSLAAVILSATGFYALISQFVDRQAQTLGIRMALGARPWDVLLLVLSRIWRLTLTGAAWALLGTFWLSELQTSLLYEISPYDIRTLLVTVVFLLLVATLGGSIPASRAMRLQPAEVLRTG